MRLFLLRRLLHANPRKPTVDDVVNDWERRIMMGQPMTREEIKAAVRKL